MLTKINLTPVWMLILVPFFYSCRKQDHKPGLLEINIEQSVRYMNQVHICDIGGEIQYIPLNSDSVLINSIRKVDFSESHILVSDNNSCVLFDLKGKFISRIGQRGKGNGEYLRITNLKFGHNSNIIIQDGRFFLIYDSCGIFLQKYKPEVNPEVDNMGGIMNSWALFNDSLFIGQVANDSGQEKSKAVIFNDLGKTIKSFDNHIFLNLKQSYYFNRNADASIYKHSGSVVFKEVLNDTVFRINEKCELEPVYYFNLGKFGMPKEEKELPLHEMIIAREKYISINSIYETSQYLFLNCDFRNNNPAKRKEPLKLPLISGELIDCWFYQTGLLGIYNKNLKELTFAAPLKSDDRLKNDGLRNDFDGGANFYPKAILNDSTLVMWVDAFQLKEIVKSEEFKNATPKYPEKKRELEKLANGLSDNDNPVLIFCTFNK